MKRGSFDFETYGGFTDSGGIVHALCCGLMTPNESPTFFHDKTHANPKGLIRAVVEYMVKRRDVHEWWAHNMGGFDGLQIISVVDGLGYKVEATLAAGSRVIGISFQVPGIGTVKLKDLYALIPAKLSKIAVDFELPSRKVFEGDDYKGDMRQLPDDRLKTGCLADCQIVLEALAKVERMVWDWGGELRSTFSSTALTIVKKHLQDAGVAFPEHIEGSDAETWEGEYVLANRIAEQSCNGGRVEVLHHNPKPLLQEFDVTSSYPWSMSQNLPWMFKEHLKVERKAQDAWKVGEDGVYQAKVTVKNQWFPPLPYRGGNGLMFPIGTWTGWFSAVELRYAVERCGVEVKILEAVTYDSAPIFKDYVEHVFETKRTAPKGALREFTKFVLNGSYGKFGEKPERTRLFIAKDALEAEMLMIHKGAVQINPNPHAPKELQKYLALTYDKYSRHAHYAVAATITGRSRTLIHEGVLKSVNPAYLDTDSIHCEQYNGNVDSTLGGFKLELDGRKYIFRAYAPKIYEMLDSTTGQPFQTETGWSVAAKGFPGGVDAFREMVASAREFQKLISEGESLARAKTRARKLGPKRVRTRLIKSQLRAASKGQAHEVLRIFEQKIWQGFSQKRKPYKNGSTRPWTVDEIESGEFRGAICPIL